MQFEVQECLVALKLEQVVCNWQPLCSVQDCLCVLARVCLFLWRHDALPQKGTVKLHNGSECADTALTAGVMDPALTCGDCPSSEERFVPSLAVKLPHGSQSGHKLQLLTGQ